RSAGAAIGVQPWQHVSQPHPAILAAAHCLDADSADGPQTVSAAAKCQAERLPDHGHVPDREQSVHCQQAVESELNDRPIRGPQSWFTSRASTRKPATRATPASATAAASPRTARAAPPTALWMNLTPSL